ncbi:hypothetical protein STCU_01779 [Strigomonas culicis]|uniref:RING-type domain-containing protein n=1 Tax=Strigomonas culicis TaxID=28005 RepID=S9UTC2_9TRYP|nr:hypothetical protein STCU_01779 [Strigomonas culicis]|eukprot:EPY34192.1 hypothetical protein STCU_01779 [Strigomonas culicis]
MYNILSSFKQKRGMHLVVLLSLLIAVQLANSVSSAALDARGGGCEDVLYHDECLGRSGCVWCCSFPFGAQCVTNYRSRMCPAMAMITSASQTCDDLCHKSVEGCTDCVQMHWCVFCSSQQKCQSPLEACENEETLQTCETKDEIKEATKMVEETLCFVSLSMFAAAFVLLSGLKAWGSFMAWREQRRERAAARARGEAQPLLQPAENPENDEEANRDPEPPSANASTNGDEESLCFMCLSARPTVTFLPCHHTSSCEACSNKLRPSKGTLTCPMCRAKIVSMISLSKVLRSLEARSS